MRFQTSSAAQYSAIVSLSSMAKDSDGQYITLGNILLPLSYLTSVGTALKRVTMTGYYAVFE